MFLLREDASKTVAEIGRLFGNRDHSTVLAGIARIQQELRTRPETAADIASVRSVLAPEAPALRAAGRAKRAAGVIAPHAVSFGYDERYDFERVDRAP
jgi:hypothetical protein